MLLHGTVELSGTRKTQDEMHEAEQMSTDESVCSNRPSTVREASAETTGASISDPAVTEYRRSQVFFEQTAKCHTVKSASVNTVEVDCRNWTRVRKVILKLHYFLVLL